MIFDGVSELFLWLSYVNVEILTLILYDFVQLFKCLLIDYILMLENCNWCTIP